MKPETNNRMEALAYIIADLKAENIELVQRVHQLVEDYNDVARQLRGMEKRKDEDQSRQTPCLYSPLGKGRWNNENPSR